LSYGGVEAVIIWQALLSTQPHWVLQFLLKYSLAGFSTIFSHLLSWYGGYVYQNENF
jgi:hypothetical protein